MPLAWNAELCKLQTLPGSGRIGRFFAQLFRILSFNVMAASLEVAVPRVSLWTHHQSPAQLHRSPGTEVGYAVPLIKLTRPHANPFTVVVKSAGSKASTFCAGSLLIRFNVERYRAHAIQQTARYASGGVSVDLRELSGVAQIRPGMSSNLHLIGQFAGSFGRTLVNRVTGRQPSYATSAEMEDWKKQATAVVTGANKGIGFAIAKKLGKEGVTTILTARNPELGAAAQKQLKEEGVDVEFHQLDISEKDSVKSFAKWLEKEHGGLDILVNNAGFAFKGNTFGANEARQTNAINYFGTRNVTQELLPLLKKSSAGARIVTVGSRAGTLSILSPELQRKFSDPQLTLEQLDQLMNEFPDQIEAGTYKQNGWPASMYGVSKVGVAAFNRILARDLAKRGMDGRVLVNVCCPGYVNTDMSSHRGYKTIDEGADTPVWLALQPPDGPSGHFFSDRKDVGY